MNIVARFYSNAQELMLHAPAHSETVMVNGIPTVQTAHQAAIEFKAHIHDAYSEAEAKILREHKAFDLLYHEVPLPQQIAAATGDKTLAPAAQGDSVDQGKSDLPPTPNTVINPDTDVIPVIGVKSKNEAISFLATEKKVTPEVLKTLKNVESVKKFALETFKITFTEWV
jgi:hypothetical protein